MAQIVASGSLCPSIVTQMQQSPLDTLMKGLPGETPGLSFVSQLNYWKYFLRTMFMVEVHTPAALPAVRALFRGKQ